MELKRPRLDHKQLFDRIDLLESRVALTSNNMPAMLELCRLYLAAGRPDKAASIAAKCRLKESHNLQVLRLLFDANFALFRLEEAKSAVREAMKLVPEKEPLLLDLAACLETEGQNADAGKIYKKLVKQVPRSSMHRSVVVARSIMFDGHVGSDRLCDEVVNLISRERIRSGNRPVLHQAAAKLHESQGRTGEAFFHYAKAGKATAKNLPPESFTNQTVLRLKQAITAKDMKALARSGSPSRRPIFVFGMQRSGTTLCEQILSSHPEIFGAGELPFFEIASSWHIPSELDSRLLTKTAGDYLELLDAFSASAERVIDKRPDNFKQLWMMAAAFPHAYFIHCRRDPLDTCVSCFKRPIKKAYRRDLRSIGRYYRNYSELMEHWRKVLPINMLELKYEELVADPEREIRKLIKHVDMEWDDACLTPHKTQRVVSTPSRNQVSSPIHNSSIGSWRQYEKYIGPLITELGELANEN